MADGEFLGGGVAVAFVEDGQSPVPGEAFKKAVAETRSGPSMVGHDQLVLRGDVELIKVEDVITPAYGPVAHSQVDVTEVGVVGNAIAVERILCLAGAIGASDPIAAAQSAVTEVVHFEL